MPDIYIPGGYILLSRRLIESEIWDKPPLYLKVWIYILTKARHRAEGSYERGELLISIPEIQEACSHKVGFRKETPTKKQIFTILEWLRNPHDGDCDGTDEFHTAETMVGTRKTTRGLVVKVHNYSVYQDPDNYRKTHEGNGEGNGKGTPEAPTEGTTGEHYTQEFKELKELKNVNNDNKTNDSREIISFYENNGYGIINGTESERIVGWLEEGFTKDAIIKAYQIGVDNNKRGKSYIDGIFRNWRNAKTFTLQEIEANDQKRQPRRWGGKQQWNNKASSISPENQKLMEERAAQREADMEGDDLPF